MSNYTILRRLEKAMLFLNIFIVLFYSALPLLSTRYIVDNELAREVLSQIKAAPVNLKVEFFAANLCFLALLLLLPKTIIKTIQYTTALLCLLLAIACTYFLNFAYNGLILLVFCFLTPSFRSAGKPWRMFLIALLLFSLSQYEILGKILCCPDPGFYLSILPSGEQSLLQVLKSLFSALNLGLFIAYMGTDLFAQLQQKDAIEQELQMVQNVNTELKSYAAITEKIGEDRERKRLAREIHDTLGHALTGIAAGVDACTVLVDVNPAACKAQLQIVSKVVRQGISDVRSSLNKLRPGALDERGFQGALEKMIQEFMDVSQLEIHLDYQLEGYDFDVTKEDAFFRSVQESITNALRHGHAGRVDVKMYAEGERICLDIQDNGTGCSEIVSGYGLRQMRERIAALGGIISFDGSNGFLTRIRVPVRKGEKF